MNIWRLQTKTSGGSKEYHIGEYCLENNAACMGWSLLNTLEEERLKIYSFEEYSTEAEKYPEKEYRGFNSVKRLYYKVKTNDLIWMRHKGQYYIGRVGENSNWFFNSSEEARKIDACNQITDIKWIKSGDENSTPGAICTSLIRGHALEQIRKEGIKEYSALLYNKLTKTRLYNVNLNLTESKFYNLLSPDDTEDLLCMWLYNKYGYIVVPSSNKKGTQLYECVLLNPKNGQHIYIQVKKGKDGINADEYKHLDGDIWLLSTEGEVKNVKNHDDKIHIAYPNELYHFALSSEAKYILPKKILTWVELLKNNNL